MLIDLFFLAVGFFVMIRHKALSREALQFQKDVFKLRFVDDPIAVRSAGIVFLIVGGAFALWSLARLSGLIH